MSAVVTLSATVGGNANRVVAFPPNMQTMLSGEPGVTLCGNYFAVKEVDGQRFDYFLIGNAAPYVVSSLEPVLTPNDNVAVLVEEKEMSVPLVMGVKDGWNMDYRIIIGPQEYENARFCLAHGAGT
ncbi:MAG TPA: hypothetical protein PLW99_01015 [Candidatus Paceibacterota bacterium]|nr:MAG: hypothetical protein B7X03_01315 [Parcubacteria group bacterium 21-58-10]HQT82714.1 hypothetical protein [Candidatus Paceibacterota bacterium]